MKSSSSGQANRLIIQVFVSSSPTCFTIRTPLVRKAMGSRLMKSTFLENLGVEKSLVPATLDNVADLFHTLLRIAVRKDWAPCISMPQLIRCFPRLNSDWGRSLLCFTSSVLLLIDEYVSVSVKCK